MTSSKAAEVLVVETSNQKGYILSVKLRGVVLFYTIFV